MASIGLSQISVEGQSRTRQYLVADFSVRLRYCTLTNMAHAAGCQQLSTASPNFYALAMAGPLNWTLPIAIRASRGRTFITSFPFRRR